MHSLSRNSANPIWQKLLYLFFLIELLLFTFLRSSAGPFLQPFMFYFSGVLVFVCGLFFWIDRPLSLKPLISRHNHYLTIIVVIVLGMAITLIEFRYVTGQYSVVWPAPSDIVPSLKVYVQRFLTGQPVYATITELGYAIPPTYLPMQWLPYVFAEWFSTDYRRIAYDILILGFAAYMVTVARLTNSYHELLLKVLLPFVALMLIMKQDSTIVGLTVETMIVGYYFLLITSIFSNSTLFRAFAIVICLLSRFSLAFWLPLFVLLIFFCESRKKAIYLCALVAVGIIGIYIVPFLSKDWSIFSNAMEYYTTAALGEWQHMAGGQPYYIYNGLSFASYFYRDAPGEMIDKLLLYKKFHLVLSVASIALCGGLYYLLRKRINHRIFALLSLKLYLATFYAFIQVPYPYLIMLSIFTSLFVLGMTSASEPETSAPGVTRKGL